MILRNDDVLKHTPGKYEGKEVDRFKFIDRMIADTRGKLIHRPTILCTEIMDYPEAIEYLRDLGPDSITDVQLHGWEHKDYVHLVRNDIEDMLKKCQDWFDQHLGYQFSIWATPWGGHTKSAEQVCNKMGIKLETVRNMPNVGAVVDHFRTGGTYDQIRDINILYHWWNRGVNIFRLCDILKYGSYELAKEFDERGWF